jgi:DNA-binding PadR family transcriptional regulator
MSDRPDQRPLSPATYQILLALAGRDRHGYAILKAIHRHTGGRVRIGPGTLYAAIRRLEDAGLIAESDWRPDADLDDERRRYYRLTAAGRAVLVAETDRLQAAVRVARRELAHGARAD